MPEWMTPLLCPVWCVPSSDSFSQITRESEGKRSSNARAVARPTMPPPMIATSYVMGSYYSRPRGGKHGAIDVSDVSRGAHWRLGRQTVRGALTAAPRRLAASVRRARGPRLHRRPAPGEWSVVEVLAH